MAIALNRPVLVIHGSQDVQVAAADYEGWSKELQRKSQAKLQVFDHLDHFLSTNAMWTLP